MNQAPKIKEKKCKVSYGEVILVSIIVPFHWSSNPNGLSMRK